MFLRYSSMQILTILHDKKKWLAYYQLNISVTKVFQLDGCWRLSCISSLSCAEMTIPTTRIDDNSVIKQA